MELRRMFHTWPRLITHTRAWMWYQLTTVKILQDPTKNPWNFIVKQWQETEPVHMTAPTQGYIAGNSAGSKCVQTFSCAYRTKCLLNEWMNECSNWPTNTARTKATALYCHLYIVNLEVVWGWIYGSLNTHVNVSAGLRIEEHYG